MALTPYINPWLTLLPHPPAAPHPGCSPWWLTLLSHHRGSPSWLTLVAHPLAAPSWLTLLAHHLVAPSWLVLLSHAAFSCYLWQTASGLVLSSGFAGSLTLAMPVFDLFLPVLIAIRVTIIIWLGWRIPLLDHASLHSHNDTHTHSHTHLITCTCCYDETKGTQDQDFSCSFSDSLSCDAHWPRVYSWFSVLIKLWSSFCLALSLALSHASYCTLLLSHAASLRYHLALFISSPSCLPHFVITLYAL